MFDHLRMYLLTLLCGASFLPQLQRILAKKDTTGIQTYALLFQSIAATEHLVIVLGLGGLSPMDDCDVEPDWLNILHVFVIWLLFNALFTLKLYYRPNDQPKPTNLLLGYACYLLLSLVPMLLTLMAPWCKRVVSPRSLSAYHLPAIGMTPALMLKAVDFQWDETNPGSGYGSFSALDVRTLASQAIIFTSTLFSGGQVSRSHLSLGAGSLDGGCLVVFEPWIS